MKIQDLVSYFADFYEDFSKIRATSMLKDLNIDQTARLKTLSKGNPGKSSSDPCYEPRRQTIYT